jgi:wyosine [tRNA(Phe)-imidazoG37] synthetase (radical SAM superfamily)
MSGIVFGPVPSRRLGRSLGINNVPHKLCSYACVYCQVGRTPDLAVERRELLPPERIVREVEARLNDLRRRMEPVDYLAFVPDGEPTLDSRLGDTIEALRPLGVPVAILSNASLVDRRDVQSDLLRADWVSLKVDAVRPEAWRRVNRPHGRLRPQDVLAGGLRFSRRFRGILATETMLVAGANDSEADIAAVARYLQALGPDVAYLSVPTRPPAEVWVRPPGEEVVLRAFQQLLGELAGTRVEMLVADEGNAFASTGDAREDLRAITAVHPMRREAVADLLARCGEGWSVVEELVAEGRLARREHGGRAFYVRRFGRPSRGAGTTPGEER